MTGKRAIYHGRVQGVGFRYATKELARGFDVCGTVRNLPDGTVEVLVGGDEEEVDAFLHEISEESNVAHHIRSVELTTLAEAPRWIGFTIVR